MTTSNSPVHTSSPHHAPRIELATPSRRRPLDGAWWPRSRDLAVELAGLVAGLPSETGRVVRAVYSPPDWDAPPRRVPLTTGYLKVGCFPRDDTHLIDLRMLDGSVLRLLVVPPGAVPEQARSALAAAARPDSTATAAVILAGTIPPPATDRSSASGWDESDQAAVDPQEFWTDDGGAWWDPQPVAPSYRPRG